MRNSFPARSEASSVKGLCLRWIVRKVLRHASSDGKNERTSAKTTDETSSVAVSAADCRHSNQASPFASPLKIVSKTDVSTATALTPDFPSDAPVAVQPAAQIIQQFIHAASGQFLFQTAEDSGPFGPIDDFAQTNAIGPGNEID